MTPSTAEQFRAMAPYIHEHRGKRIVIMVPGQALPDTSSLIHDIALLQALGLKIVVVHGFRPQLEALMRQAQLEAGFHQGVRITPAQAQPLVLAAAGATRLQLEAALSQGMPNSPMAHARVRVVGGNFVHGRPMGVLDGVDMQHTGCVRSIDESALNRHLDQGDLVLVSCIGHSLTGETFNLRLQDVAHKIATTLRADKLVILGKHWPTTLDDEHLREIAAAELLDCIKQTPEDRRNMLALAAQTCNLGVERVHLLDWRSDGVLLDELFTRDGVGTMVYRTAYERLRRANASDVGNLIELLRPMEEQGFLVKQIGRAHV